MWIDELGGVLISVPSVVERIVGYVIPFAVSGLVLLGVGNGLLTTLTPHTSTGKWIGYQILLGTGRGLAMMTVRPISSPEPP